MRGVQASTAQQLRILFLSRLRVTSAHGALGIRSSQAVSWRYVATPFADTDCGFFALQALSALHSSHQI
jgi:hypothetical protein